MGNKALSLMTRPLKNFNIEDRAHKIISKDMPVPAPKYKIDQLESERMMQEYPEVFEESLKKNEQLDKYLKNVFVQSHEPVIETAFKRNPDRPLPLDRTQVFDFEYGVKEPESVPLGKITLKNVLKFITDHQSNFVQPSAQTIAEQYLIPEETVKNILKNYRIFEVYIPEQRKAKAKFAGPSVPRIRVMTQAKKQIAAPPEVGKDNT